VPPKKVTPPPRRKAGPPRGYRCTCGRDNKFTPWVYAHWTLAVTATCGGCGHKATAVQGVVRRGKTVMQEI
jgi:hypothetical protein